MSADGKIYIVITDKMPAGGTPQTPTPTQPNQSDEKEGLFAHWARTQILNTARKTAMTAVTYSMSNIGNFTGDYITQTHVNDSIANLRSFLRLGASTLAGFKVGGPIGAVVGATIGVVNETISSFTTIHSAMVQNRKTNYEIEQLRNRAGLNATLDGSRGTEN